MTKEILIIDGTTKTETQRPMTAEELAEYDYRWRDPKEIEAENAKVAAKKAAETKLAALGLTEEEIAALRG